MKITAEATSTITEVEGVMCRVWKARTEKGTPCFLLVHRIIVEGRENQDEFEAELRSMPAPNMLPLPMALDPRSIVN